MGRPPASGNPIPAYRFSPSTRSDMFGRVPELATNSFEVFSSQERGHENHLTRALLVLLRLSPLAHQVWLRQIGLGDVGLVGVGEPTYGFQTGTVPEIDPETQEEPARGISIFITREPAYNSGEISSSANRQIPDGLITYAGQDKPIVTVVESKVREAADAVQAREINLGGVRADWDPKDPVELRWSALIDELWSLLDLGAMSASEARLLLDFFDFVDHYYREVGPYSTLRRCGGVRERLRLRCRTVLGEATEKDAHPPRRGREPYVEIEGPPSLPRRVGLDLDEDSENVRLSFWPADTPSQARAFYSDPHLPDRVLELAQEPGWEVRPNMHFGHFQAGYAWLPVPPDTSAAEYLAFWREHRDLPTTVYRDREPNWDDFLSKLSDEGIIASREAFDHDFVRTGRNKADVRPGLELSRVWSIAEATDLDDRAELKGDVREAFFRARERFGAVCAAR
jgi:hypothetical protein